LAGFTGYQASGKYTPNVSLHSNPPLHPEMTPMWAVVVHVLLPVIDLRQISDVLEQQEQNSTYPLELEVKLKNSLTIEFTSVGRT
jgi:hypothetical protein